MAIDLLIYDLPKTPKNKRAGNGRFENKTQSEVCFLEYKKCIYFISELQGTKGTENINIVNFYAHNSYYYRTSGHDSIHKQEDNDFLRVDLSRVCFFLNLKHSSIQNIASIAFKLDKRDSNLNSSTSALCAVSAIFVLSVCQMRTSISHHGSPGEHEL